MIRRAGVPRKSQALTRSVERAEDGGDFFDDDAEAEAALAEFGVKGGVGIGRAGEDARDLDFVFGKAFGVGMAGVFPVAEKAFTTFRHAPEDTAIFQFGVFLIVNAIDEHRWIIA
jgi:hypothetical protein